VHLNKRHSDYDLSANINVLVPEVEEQYWLDFLADQQVTVMSGDLNNVLSRFKLLYDAKKPRYIVRLTADCAGIPWMVMNKMIFIANHHRLDYVTNAWEYYRTAPDGHDIEVLSSIAMEWLFANAREKDHLEHVTLAIRRYMPSGLRKAAFIAKEDLSDIKLCIDTDDEYARCKVRFDKAIEKREAARRAGLGIYDY
jgi:spore coat polysaccharide biosynthesis protein SpsF